MRVLLSVLRGEDVTAERLARVASFERESFLKTRQAPRLCSAIFPDGTAPPKRVWARGDWRLARRIITADAEHAWQAWVGIYACDLLLEHGLEDERLGPLAHEFAAQSIGPIAAYYPGSREQWEELRAALRQFPFGPGVATQTGQQGIAEQSLRNAELTPFSLYFGLEASAGISRGPRPRELRLAAGGERGGVPFDELVRIRAGGDAAKARNVLAYVEAFGRQLDELGRIPSLGEYAERWNVDVETAARERDDFASIFPSEEDPAAIAGLLWDGIGRRPGSFTRLLGVEVIRAESFPTVIGYFLNCVADELRSPLGAAAMSEAMVLEEAPPVASKELRRFFALCARAVDVWCADALGAMSDQISAQGLRSLETVTEEATASFTEKMLGHYRLRNRNKPGKDVLLSTQKALRVAASLRALEPPESTLPYLDGIRWAAKALVAAQRDTDTDLVAEAQRTTQRLDAVY
jgi:hypothetical protein